MDSITLVEIGFVIIVWLLFPNRLAPINLFFLGIGLLSIYAFRPYISPYISQKEYKKTAMREIEEIDLIIPVASSLKKIKPNSYEELISDIALNHAIAEGSSDAQKTLSDYRTIMRVLGRFFQSAFDEDVLKYTRAHLKFIRELKQINPDSVLRFHYPNQFGLLDFETLLKAQSRFEYHNAVENLLESGKTFYAYPPPNNREHSYLLFFTEFKVRHPAEASALSAPYTAQTSAHRLFLAEALLLFHSEVTNRSPKETSDIWRYMVANQ